MSHAPIRRLTDMRSGPTSQPLHPARGRSLRSSRWLRCATIVSASALVIAADAAPVDVGALSAGGDVGPWPATDFTLARGRDAHLPRSPAWYFADEYIAVPRDGIVATSIVPGTSVLGDIARALHDATPPAAPPMVWVGATEVLHDARISEDGSRITADGRARPLALVPKIPLNRSYFDASSARFASTRALTLRGESRDGAFVMRSLWPQDFALDASLPVTPLDAATPAALAIRGLMRATPDGGAREPMAVRLLYSRDGAARDWRGMPALLVMVNGAQGDDDEAWGGHFAIGTGIVGERGAIGDFIVDNFYSLDVESEKGILAAPTPLDRYLGDLNSGQGWYRPSFLAIVVLDDAHAALAVQDAFNRMFLQFWRHRLVYRHATMNCTGISVDTLRALGLPVPSRGATSYGAAWLAVPYALAKYRSLDEARTIYEYLTEDVTRLLPAAAFEDTLATLLRLARDGTAPGDGALASTLARDIAAIAVLRLPQWPSSRKFGSFPVVTPGEYFAKLPSDPADMVTVEVPPRPFPAALRDPDVARDAARRSDVALAVWAGIVAIALGYALRLIRRRRAAA